MLVSRKLGKLFCFTLLTLADCLNRNRSCGKATVQWMQNASCPDSWNACSCIAQVLHCPTKHVPSNYELITGQKQRATPTAASSRCLSAKNWGNYSVLRYSLWLIAWIESDFAAKPQCNECKMQVALTVETHVLACPAQIPTNILHDNVSDSIFSECVSHWHNHSLHQCFSLSN